MTNQVANRHIELFNSKKNDFLENDSSFEFVHNGIPVEDAFVSLRKKFELDQIRNDVRRNMIKSGSFKKKRRFIRSFFSRLASNSIMFSFALPSKGTVINEG